MAFTVESIAPAEGHTGGRTLVEIIGTGFQIDPPPPAEGETTPNPSPPMRVLFGGKPATAVAVVSSTQLYCLTPISDEIINRDAGGLVTSYGAVDVRIDNIDAQTGALISGETATLAAAYTFRRPDLSKESELARIVRMLLRELKRQIIENVSFATHTDYDSSTGDTLNIALVADIPALVLSNVEMNENRGDFVIDDEEPFPAGTGMFILRRPPVVVDVTMNLVGVTNDPIELLNLMQACRLFFRKNPYLYIDRDPEDASRGKVKYPIEFLFDQPVAVTRQGDNSNIQSFSGPIAIRGVLLEDIPGLSNDKPAGIPAHYPHEATIAVGFEADGAVVSVQKKPED